MDLNATQVVTVSDESAVLEKETFVGMLFAIFTFIGGIVVIPLALLLCKFGPKLFRLLGWCLGKKKAGSSVDQEQSLKQVIHNNITINERLENIDRKVDEIRQNSLSSSITASAASSGSSGSSVSGSPPEP